MEDIQIEFKTLWQLYRIYIFLFFLHYLATRCSPTHSAEVQFISVSSTRLERESAFLSYRPAIKMPQALLQKTYIYWIPSRFRLIEVYYWFLKQKQSIVSVVLNKLFLTSNFRGIEIEANQTNVIWSQIRYNELNSLWLKKKMVSTFSILSKCTL